MELLMHDRTIARSHDRTRCYKIYRHVVRGINVLTNFIILRMKECSSLLLYTYVHNDLQFGFHYGINIFRTACVRDYVRTHSLHEITLPTHMRKYD